MSYETCGLLATIAFVVAGACFVLAVGLFFALHVPEAAAIVSGRSAARGIARIQEHVDEGSSRPRRGSGRVRTGRFGRVLSPEEVARASGPTGTTPMDVPEGPTPTGTTQLSERLVGPTGTTLLESTKQEKEEAAPAVAPEPEPPALGPASGTTVIAHIRLSAVKESE